MSRADLEAVKVAAADLAPAVFAKARGLLVLLAEANDTAGTGRSPQKLEELKKLVPATVTRVFEGCGMDDPFSHPVATEFRKWKGSGRPANGGIQLLRRALETADPKLILRCVCCDRPIAAGATAATVNSLMCFRCLGGVQA